jgi:hypothetical protein
VFTVILNYTQVALIYLTLAGSGILWLGTILKSEDFRVNFFTYDGKIAPRQSGTFFHNSFNILGAYARFGRFCLDRGWGKGELEKAEFCARV